MKKNTILLFTFTFSLLFFVLPLFQNEVLAGKGIKKVASLSSSRLLEIEEPTILPTSPFYFLKEWQRGVRKFFVFDSVKKAELEARYADEKLAEFSKVVDENCEETEDTQNVQCNKEALQKAFDNYFVSQQKLSKRLESLDEKNPNIEKLLSKVGERVILHQALFDELIHDVPEAEEAIGTETRRIITSNGQTIIRAIKKPTETEVPEAGTKEAIPESVEQAIRKLPYPEEVKELKILEILTRIEEHLPEEAKKGIKTAKEAIQKKLVETGEIQKATEWKVEQGSSDWIMVEGVPVETKAFGNVVGELEEKSKIPSPIIQKPNVAHVEAIKELKIKIQEAQKVTDKNFSESEGGTSDQFPALAPLAPCPAIFPGAFHSKEACVKSIKQLEEKYPGCAYYTDMCEKISPRKPSLDCGPSPAAPGNWKCINGAWKNVDMSQCGKIQCLRYDPVCGLDGKTYSCGEADAQSCGVEIAHKGECKKEKFLAPHPESLAPLPQEKPVTPPQETSGVSATELFQPISCTQEWNPVCGTDNKTYSNECMAKAAGVEIQYKGKCTSNY